MADTTVDNTVEIEEMTPEQARVMLEVSARERFGTPWEDFYGAYAAGAFVGTDRARDAEDLAFLAPFAG